MSVWVCSIVLSWLSVVSGHGFFLPSPPPACAGAVEVAGKFPDCPFFRSHAADGRVTVQRAAMGTVFTVRAYPGCGMDLSGTEEACEQALACARHWEKVMSAMDAESSLASFNDAEAGVEVPVSSELRRAVALSLEYARLTHGSFDPTLGPCVRLWRKSRRRGMLPSHDELERARRASGWRKLSLGRKGLVKAVEGMRVDLGGMGKGFAVDRMAEVLRGKGVKSFFIDSTSDVLAGAPPPGAEGWKLKVMGEEGKSRTLLLKHAAVSTSGSIHQFVKIGNVVYSHVLDPSTGLGVTKKRQASVLAPSAALADALATAACVMAEREFRALVAKMPGVSLVNLVGQP